MASSNKKILFLVEGKSESKSVKNIAEKMFSLTKENYEIVSNDTVIYELFKKLRNDPDLSLVGYLKAEGKITLKPGELSKEAFSQIYLIFDFDPHYGEYSDDGIREMLRFFDNETENGKLYINYPMFEATFYIDDFDHPERLYEMVSISECNGKCFKKRVREISCFGRKNHLDFSLRNPNDVYQSIRWNFKRAIYLIKQNELDYMMILEKQIESKNSETKKFLILSTFVLMIIDYNPEILKVIETKLEYKL